MVGVSGVDEGYRNRLKDLLSSGWKGPHGFAGRWVFTGDF